MRRWWWVRHGPTGVRNMVGWTDLPADLSDRDRIARLAAALPGGATVASSTLQRSIQTAAATHGQAPDLALRLPDLREMHFGDWENRSFADVARDAPDLSRRFWEMPGDTAPPGGESWNLFRDRVAAGISALDARTDKAEDLVVHAHFGTILAALQIATGMPPAAVFSFRIDNLSVTRIDALGPGQWRVARVNDCP
ncbi:histidine phosphatase family protein [Oceanomicrobium pacificus]|uniref:Histidine phosphatase family protein n=1 Tax=Oceanomicrobium pacificus TaxID=2692916 RepID=A0A6B0TJ79_9RHOB|nr:histidine phosphatase family protein [Oceanomicrobium pacificus]MXU64470.1 histidine phosphatase family protein [Oceanomicrobium pacificus]